MNDGYPTFISSSGHASSSIDLSIGSRDLRLLSSTIILQDLHGSDHFPISISLAETSPSFFPIESRFLIDNFPYYKFISEISKFNFLILSSSPPLNLLQKYKLFCSLLMDTISSVFSQGDLPLRRSTYRATDYPPLGIPLVQKRLKIAVLYFVCIKLILPGTIW